MATQLKAKSEETRSTLEAGAEEAERQDLEPASTIVGWQGVQCTLPPEWNVTGFSMERDNGYLRIDAPGNATMTVQIRWTNAARPNQGPPNLSALLAPHWRRLRRLPEPQVVKPNLRENLERIFKETAKQSKKAKAVFDSSTKPEKSEGEDGERTAINFSWTGAGRGQGKIYYCATCHRVVVAQVVGLIKDQAAMNAIASILFGGLHCHAKAGYDRWALYDAQVEIPEDFRIESQKLLSGYLHLVFARGAERIVLDRWGLANVTLKKFTRDEWLHNNALVSLKKLTRGEETTGAGHPIVHYAGGLGIWGSLRALRESRASLRRFPSCYEGGLWECPDSNKLYAVQVMTQKRNRGLWAEVVKRCVCH